jgi:hypothetical protein
MAVPIAGRPVCEGCERQLEEADGEGCPAIEDTSNHRGGRRSVRQGRLPLLAVTQAQLVSGGAIVRTGVRALLGPVDLAPAEDLTYRNGGKSMRCRAVLTHSQDEPHEWLAIGSITVHYESAAAAPSQGFVVLPEGTRIKAEAACTRCRAEGPGPSSAPPKCDRKMAGRPRCGRARWAAQQYVLASVFNQSGSAARTPVRARSVGDPR